MNQLLAKYKTLRNYHYQLRLNKQYNVRFYNFWKQNITDMWFYRFIQARHLLNDSTKKVCFYSTFGNRNIIHLTRGNINVFFTGENLKSNEHCTYADHLLLENQLHLALGFELFEDNRYLRFPLWIMYMFSPESHDEDIKRKCDELNHPGMGNHTKFASHISRGDILGLRQNMCNMLSQIDRVDCAGKMMHNCDDLWKVFNDDKTKFLSEYKFNICPENSNCEGYVTEKVFQAIEAGCIPVYWGSFNHPEPEVLNHNAIIFWNKDGDNIHSIETIRELHHSSKLYEEFIHQNRLAAGAAEYVINKFNELESKLRNLI